MLINIFFDAELLDADVLDVPDDSAVELVRLQSTFHKWLFNEANEHPFWLFKNGKKSGCCYRGEAFVYWLNNYCLDAGGKPALLAEQWAECIDYDRPALYM
jgi:hypothetical protein